jgi:hypothetical protein
MRDIYKEVKQLQKERRDFINEATKDYDEIYYARMRELQAACPKHNWRFSHHGPLGHAWFYCSVCTKSKVEDES